MVYPPVGPEKVAEAVTKIITMLLGLDGVVVVVFKDEDALRKLSVGVFRVRSLAVGVTGLSEVVVVL